MKYPRLFREGQSYKLTQEEIKEIKSLFQQGFSKHQIARKFNVSAPAIGYHTNSAIKERVNKLALESKEFYKEHNLKWNRKRKVRKEMKLYWAIKQQEKRNKIIEKLLSPEEFKIYTDYYLKVLPKIRN